jgi:epoxyqueuosine reductase QueG
MNLKEAIRQWAGDRVDAIGFAPVSRFDGAPEAHHPSRICKDAQTVIVLGKAVPRGILHSPLYALHMLHRTYHSVYMALDEVSLALSNWIEAQGEHLAVPIPSYAPMVFHGSEPWGVLSLKHAAAQAGLGRFGRNELLHHPRYGTLLRLAAVVTSAPLEGDAVLESDPCPEECNACLKACPPAALDEGGPFRKMTCLQHTIKHAIYPLALKTEEGLKQIERVINTAGHNYWLACQACLKVCPSNARRVKGRTTAKA